MNQQNLSSPSELFNRPVYFLKRVKRLAAELFLQSMDAFYDFYRYARYSNSVLIKTDNRQVLEPLLFFYYHKIEKALALPDIKPLFGLDYVRTTLELARKWVQITGDQEAVVFRGACCALISYQDHVNLSLKQADPGLAQLLDQFISEYVSTDRVAQNGGAVLFCEDHLHSTCTNMNFEQLVNHRHSVRNFVDRHILDQDIQSCVKLAQHTPSVCNRQCWRVHVYSSPADKARVLSHQNGNNGFGHLADRVILITADLGCFLTSGERHQAMVDAGMFSMTLILALESRGIASCCLNLCLSSREEISFRRTCELSVWEYPVMLIVIGYPPERLNVAVSARKPTESMLTFRDLDREDSHNN